MISDSKGFSGDVMSVRKGIDIIIPVYNALDDLKICIESIKKHTDFALDRVLLIDDRSTDANVYPYLKSIEQPGMIVMQNEQNLGFSGTINCGLQYSDRDVLLLNADTIVTENWVNKIVACAYSDASIGTVTPFSNNATLCSIPNFCEENTVPYGLSIDEYAQVIESCSMRKYPRITVAVGFCMFIKREVVNRVGLFDKETFERGYGEENDFCWRAEQLGYYHVLCDDTYIYHSGTASFQSEEKRRLIAEHEEILHNRYPQLVRRNMEYVRDNPHQYLRTNVDIYTKLKNGKRNILYVLHADFRADAADNIGGTQFHVKDLAMNLRVENNVFVLARDGQFLRLTVYLENDRVSFKFYIGEKSTYQPFHRKEIAEVIRNVLVGFTIDVVHVHHVSDLSFDIFGITKKLGIPLLLTLHDYYYICPTVKLLECGTVYCGGNGKNCDRCLNQQLGYASQVDYMPIWRTWCRQALGLCDKLIVPSDAAKKIYAEVYPEVADRICVIPHGMDSFEQELSVVAPESTPGFKCYIEHAFESGYAIDGWAYQEGCDASCSEIFVRVVDLDGKIGEYQAQTVNRPDLATIVANGGDFCCGFSVHIPDVHFASGQLNVQLIIKNGGKVFHSAVMKLDGYVRREKICKRIAFLGGLNPAKGSQLACQMISQSGRKYDWYIVGGTGDPALTVLEKSNLTKTGWYKRENVKAILNHNQIDLVCILPIWPETFCYTISEAQIAGIPVLATDIGAVGDRVIQEHSGWVVPYDAQAKEILDKLDDIFEAEDDFREVREAVCMCTHRTIGEMCRDYDVLYRTLPILQRTPKTYDAQFIYMGYAACHLDAVDSCSMGNNIELVRRITELEHAIAMIENSLGYKVLRFFKERNIPGKKMLKRMIKLAYLVYVKLFK